VLSKNGFSGDLLRRVQGLTQLRQIQTSGNRFREASSPTRQGGFGSDSDDDEAWKMKAEGMDFDLSL
jgi:hypothetical protein